MSHSTENYLSFHIPSAFDDSTVDAITAIAQTRVQFLSPQIFDIKIVLAEFDVRTGLQTKNLSMA